MGCSLSLKKINKISLFYLRLCNGSDMIIFVKYIVTDGYLCFYFVEYKKCCMHSTEMIMGTCNYQFVLWKSFIL